MKSYRELMNCLLFASPSTRREWIEIQHSRISEHSAWSPSTRREWIEIVDDIIKLFDDYGSPSTRREWIEILPFARARNCQPVSLHAEGVD